MRPLRSGAALALAVALMLAGAPRAPAYTAGAPRARASTGAPRAPAYTPPVPVVAAAQLGAPTADASSSAPASAGDPLVDNGLGSALCRSRALEAGLSRTGLANCRTSGFAASRAPTGNYGFDVHIDVPIGIGGDTLALIVQDLLLTPLWTALVWIVHALIVALEWCYAIDLLDPSTMGSVGAGLRAAQSTFTQPWLVAALALASMLALYHGVVRRRVAETIGEFLLMLAMMAAGLWVIVDPAGTVGAVGRWANQASLGTLAAVSYGSPDHAARSFGDGLQGVFASAIGAPWCYLEFGDVGWCRDSVRLDPRLHAAALRIAFKQLYLSSCHLDTGPIASPCAPAGSAAAQSLIHSADLLRSAQTNGDVFLALPANQDERNSINEPSSLLRILCGTQNATRCTGSTASQAEFRTGAGTWPRAGGLLLILIGSAGTIALLAFIALRLLGAAVATLFYLLFAPVAVLAPALGDGGRGAFRRWGTRLLGATLAKLVYSALLGVVLLALRILLALGALGWWTQWLLISAFWWTVFQHRHEVLRLASLGDRETGTRGLRVVSGLMAAREVSRFGGTVRRTITRPPAPSPPEPKPPPPVPPPRRPDPALPDRAQASELRSGQVTRTLERDYHEARARVAAAPATERWLVNRGSRLRRIRAEVAAATASGDTRRAARLEDRGARLHSAIEREQAGLAAARRTTSTGERARASSGLVHDEHQRAARSVWLDTQARLPRGAPGSAHGDAPARREYRALATLAGHSPAEYERLSPRRQLAARAAIDRELDQRLVATQALRGAAGAAEPARAAHQPATNSPRRPGPLTPIPPRRQAPPASRRRDPESPALRRERQFARWRAPR